MSDSTLNGRLRHLVRELVEQGITLQQARDEFERQFLLAALDRYDGSLSRSAEGVGIHRNTLRNKICTLGIAESAEERPPRAARR